MPRKGRNRKPGVPRKKRVRDELVRRNTPPTPPPLEALRWPHEVELKIGDSIEIQVRIREHTIFGTLVDCDHEQESYTIDRMNGGRIQVKGPWKMRKVNLLERLAMEVADAERADV